MKKIYLLFLSFLIVFLSIHGQTEIEKEIIIDLIEAAFDHVADESDINGKNQKDSCIIISETFTTTISNYTEQYLKNELASLDSCILNDFIEKNQGSVKIAEFCLDQIKITYMSKNEWEKTIKEGGWAHYHSIYGYIPTINLSRPGINEKKNKALIYYDIKSDKLGGAGFYLILEKVNNKWIIKENTIAWRS